MSINKIKECLDPLSNAISMKLVENRIIETTNKNGLQLQIGKCLEKLTKADDFDIDYQAAPFRNVCENPNIVSLYITAFVLEKLIDDRDVVDIFGSDEEVYQCINKQVKKFLTAEEH